MKKNFTAILFITSFLFLKSTIADAQVNMQDSLALVALYNSTDGTHWIDHTNWLTSAPVGSWSGITENNYRVRGINRVGNNLKGTLPIELGNLTQLKYLFLENNKISGSIPSSIGKCTKLYDLVLGTNQLSGHIPSELGNLIGLSELVLQNNQLTGSIPSSLGNLTSLFSLILDHNKLTGTIPSALDNLTELNELLLQNNKFTFAGMEKIATAFPFATYAPQTTIPLHKNGNVLSVSAGGTLSNNNYTWYKNGQPYISKIGDSSLTVDTGVYYVTVSNSIATALTLQSDTVVVDFQFPPINKNDSLVLVDIYNSTDGQHWAANTKWLTEAPVHTWEGVTVLNDRVTELILWGALKNQFPSSIGNLSALTSISVGDSYLTGSLPSSIGNLTQLKIISFEFNDYMNGTLPSELGNLTNLTDLFFYSNAIRGKIPTSLGNLKNLVHLTLSANRLTGNIPPELGNLSQLQTLDLSFNKLTGKIPTVLHKLTNLQTLWLNRNRLTDGIPDLDDLTELHALNLQLNNFTFAGLGRIARAFPFAIYSPQAIIPLHKNNNILSVYAGGANALAHNTYKWYKGSTLVATIIGDSTYQPTINGNYSVAVTNSIATALTLYSDTVHVSVSDNSIASGNNSYVNILNAKVSVYPNPAKSNATLSFNADGKYTINISDVSGKILQTKTGVTFKGINTIQLDVSKYASGLYLVTITDEKNRKQTLRLSKE